MKAFRRTRDGIRWRSSRNEVRLLRTLAEQLVEMVAPPEAADGAAAALTCLMTARIDALAGRR